MKSTDWTPQLTCQKADESFEHVGRNFLSSAHNQPSDYRALYEKERQRALLLEHELSILQTQSQSLSRELAGIYEHSKNKRRQLALTNEQLVRYASDLCTIVSNLRGANTELQEAYQDTIHRLVLASEYKDRDTGNHITRMSKYSALLASRAGLSSAEIENIHFAAPMHDVGKIGIPDSIILKNGMLTAREFDVIKTHTTIGADILQDSKAKILQTARVIAHAHHEKWDGTGYPLRLSGQDIPLTARIVAISDAFDALTSKRPYKSPYPIDASCDIIKRERERQFDPELVDIFLDNIDEITAIKLSIDTDHADGHASQDFILSERDRAVL